MLTTKTTITITSSSPRSNVTHLHHCLPLLVFSSFLFLLSLQFPLSSPFSSRNLAPVHSSILLLLLNLRTPYHPTRIFHQTVSTATRRSLGELATDLTLTLQAFVVTNGEPIESHGNSVDSLPGNEQESSPAPFRFCNLSTSTTPSKLNLPLLHTCPRSVNIFSTRPGPLNSMRPKPCNT